MFKEIERNDPPPLKLDFRILGNINLYFLIIIAFENSRQSSTD